ncbi:MAG: twin-arginine translocase subunit TatC [Acidilobaceae archaeon]|nr:twin-arginine translocase subunit TatC [Acidilobaceae archaeon]
MGREATIWEHLEELLIRLRKALLAFAIATLIVPFLPISLSSYEPLVYWVPRALISHTVPEKLEVFGKEVEVKLSQTSPFGGLKILLYSALLIGFLASSPYVAYQLYAFIEPALYPHEKRWLLVGGFFAIALFLTGASLALLVILPFTYRIMFMLSYLVVGDMLIAYADPVDIMSSALFITIATGLAFEIPLVVFVLVYLDVVRVSSLTSPYMRLLLIVSAVIAALISPDPSGIGMILMLVPYFSLIIGAVVLANFLKKRRS